MRSTTIFAVLCSLAVVTTAAAQTRTQTQTTTQSTTRTTGASAPAQPAPPAPPAAPPNGSRFLPVNVKIDVTIADQQNGQMPVKRTASVIASDGNRGSVRSQVNLVGVPYSVPLDIDALPIILSDGHIKLVFTMSYDLPGTSDQAKTGQVTRSTLSNSLTLVLTDGKPLQVSQSADAVGDRQVTVEVKATVLK